MSLAEAQRLDAQDPLASCIAQFEIPQGLIYLDGNSLGPLTSGAKQRAMDVVNTQWGQDLITSWNKHQWIELPARVGAKVADIIGAAADEVICCDSTSVNLFKLLCAALKLRPNRTRIVSEKGNFPTDLYMAQGLRALLGEHIELHFVEREDILASLDDDVAVVMLTQVDFRSGHMLDIQQVSEACHQVGALTLWDLAHSAGAVPLSLSEWNVDLAVGCGYKYLNGGPGAPAFAYVAKRLQSNIQQPLSGWMGHANPFAFAVDYTPAAGINSLLCGTPAVLSMSVLDAALDVFAGLNMADIRDKSLLLSEHFLQWVDEDPACSALQLISPRAPELRGSQLAYRHPQAYALCQALIADGVVADFRAPDILRLGLAPLYLRFSDLWRAKTVLADILTKHTYLDAKFQQRQKVT